MVTSHLQGLRQTSGPKPIRIIGGGPAGLTLGIALRQRNIPVMVIEAGHYPRHRVCGEFLSGRGRKILEQLGLMVNLLEAGGVWARDAAFFMPGRPPVKLHPPELTLCISRFTLDDLLAREFVCLGGELQVGQRWRFEPGCEGIVCATGRRIRASSQGWRWFGLKAHAHHLALQADLEMHLLDHGYVGLCRLDNKVNVCGLFRSRTPVPDLALQWRKVLSGGPGSELNARLESGEFDEQSFCSVAGLCPGLSCGDSGAECVVGDAWAMPPPLSGNGLSMAIEAAEIAVESLAQYHCGGLPWQEAKTQILWSYQRRFQSRLRVAGWLHQVMFHALGRRLMFFLLHHCAGLMPIVYRLTR